MSSSNYRRNKAAINQFRKELMAMVEDIQQIDVRVLNKAVNTGIAYAKRNTPVGNHPNPVSFTVKNGPSEGTVVSFKVSNPGVGGFLRKSWHKLPTKKTKSGVEAEVVNNANYASYWNYGHRIVTKKGGPTKGFVKGTFVLEKTAGHVQKQLVKEFEKEVKAVQERHD
ncbi:HK97 gp10 family phage protein [Hungatella hathewayi]|uniref:HK97 gp10 family phage protein n=1 Tax=Hungatella hathewayi TaxID=154046 RepID=UPI00210A6352|nr:HK97 gp10 family phage protein [Hungatella hathewayi]MCQ5384273.1 HK97 gp10 family phage protein [Hungatella hathewayi]